MQTRRLSLLPMASDDEALFVELYTDPSVMAQVQAPLTVAQAMEGFHAALAEGHATATKTSWWILRERRPSLPGEVADARAPGPSIGLVGLRHGRASAEIGALLLPKAQGRGLAVEAIAVLIDAALARPELQALRIRHERSHPPGAAVARALGFARGADVGTLARWELAREAWIDSARRERFASRPSQV